MEPKKYYCSNEQLLHNYADSMKLQNVCPPISPQLKSIEINRWIKQAAAGARVSTINDGSIELFCIIMTTGGANKVGSTYIIIRPNSTLFFPWPFKSMEGLRYGKQNN